VIVQRTDGGQRRYSEDDFALFSRIKTLVYGQGSPAAAKEIIQAGPPPGKTLTGAANHLITGGTGSFGNIFAG
jgi:DNA-binding transcriptional MerR regulator